MKKCISCSSKKLYSIYNFGNLPLSNEFVKKEKRRRRTKIADSDLSEFMQ